MQGSTVGVSPIRVGWSNRPTAWSGLLNAVTPVSTVTDTGASRPLDLVEWAGGVEWDDRGWCEPVQWLPKTVCTPTGVDDKPGPCAPSGGGVALPFPLFQWGGCDMNLQSRDSEIRRVTVDSLLGQAEVPVASELWASTVLHPDGVTFNPDLSRSATVIPGGPYTLVEATRLLLRAWFGVNPPGVVGAGHGWVPWFHAPADLSGLFLETGVGAFTDGGWSVGPAPLVLSPGYGTVGPDGAGGVTPTAPTESWLMVSGPVEASVGLIEDVAPAELHRLNKRLWFAEALAVVRPMTCRVFAVRVAGSGGC